MINSIISYLREKRVEAKLSAEGLNEILNLGSGWIRAFESGNTAPTLDFIIAISRALNLDPASIFKVVDFSSKSTILTHTIEVQDYPSDAPRGANIEFRYNSFLAKVFIPSASRATYLEVAKRFRDNLQNKSKTEAVVDAFMDLVIQWPDANPSDIWWFVMSRLYSDPYLHPATEAHRDFGQSWKRTGGWALERIFAAHYKEFLAVHGIEIGIYGNAEKNSYLQGMNLNYHVQANKADVLLINADGAKKYCFGVAHVKASIAERRQNDQNFSRALLDKNFFSPFITMDCKSTPSTHPLNKGEFGVTSEEKKRHPWK